jgi:hypothetical protein
MIFCGRSKPREHHLTFGPTLLAVGYRLVVEWAPGNREVAKQT